MYKHGKLGISVNTSLIMALDIQYILIALKMLNWSWQGTGNWKTLKYHLIVADVCQLFLDQIQLHYRHRFFRQLQPAVITGF